MDSIYFEKQDALLCGVHCVNNLLQGKYFTEIEFMDIARDLDMKELNVRAEVGETTEFLNFAAQESHNVSDEGNFSQPVLEQALKVFDLSLVSFTSPEAGTARTQPDLEQAFICNYEVHWFAIRRINGYFWNLNSLFKAPEMVSPTHLHLLLAQLQTEGYSIYVVRGLFPTALGAKASETDNPYIGGNEISQEEKDFQEALKLSTADAYPSSNNNPHGIENEMERAIALSLREDTKNMDGGESDLDRAIQMSLNLAQPNPPSRSSGTLVKEPSDAQPEDSTVVDDSPEERREKMLLAAQQRAKDLEGKNDN